MGPEALAQVLRPLTLQSAPPSLLVGLHTADDAAVYQVNEEQAIISTADFFPPVVDDPYAFGAIAAANALSDIYAMGGQPLMAINLVAWPADLDPTLLSEILRGGAEIVAQGRRSHRRGAYRHRRGAKIWAGRDWNGSPQAYFDQGRGKAWGLPDLEQAAWHRHHYHRA